MVQTSSLHSMRPHCSFGLIIAAPAHSNLAAPNMADFWSEVSRMNLGGLMLTTVATDRCTPPTLHSTNTLQRAPNC